MPIRGYHIHLGVVTFPVIIIPYVYGDLNGLFTIIIQYRTRNIVGLIPVFIQKGRLGASAGDRIQFNWRTDTATDIFLRRDTLCPNR